MSNNQNNILQFALPKKEEPASNKGANATIALNLKEYSNLVGVMDAATDLCRAIAAGEEETYTPLVQDLALSLDRYYKSKGVTHD